MQRPGSERLSTVARAIPCPGDNGLESQRSARTRGSPNAHVSAHHGGGAGTQRWIRPPDYEELGSYVDALRRPQGLHLTLLHIGVLEDFAQDIATWTRGITAAGEAARLAAAWLEGFLPWAPFPHGLSGWSCWAAGA